MKRCLPPDSNPCQRANSRRRWFVRSPRSGDIAVRISRPVPANGGSSSVGSGFILPSSSFSSKLTHIWRYFESKRAGATVLCCVSRCNSCVRRIPVSILHEPFEHVEFVFAHFTLFNCANNILTFCLGIEVASFNAFTSDHKLWVNSSGDKGRMSCIQPSSRS